MKDLDLRDWKDTLVGASVTGGDPLDDFLPRYHPTSQVFPFAFVLPVRVDCDGNGRFDELTNYGERGR
jgi:hypothetical protein